jgi:hypothetical protein
MANDPGARFITPVHHQTFRFSVEAPRVGPTSAQRVLDFMMEADPIGALAGWN